MKQFVKFSAVLVAALAVYATGVVHADPKLNFKPPTSLIGQDIPRVERIEIKRFVQAGRIAIATNGTSYRLPLNAKYVFEDGRSARGQKLYPGQRIQITALQKRGPIPVADKIVFEQM